jgi:hypothetical protein
VVVESTPVPLNPQDASQVRSGRFTYAGGIALRSESSLLHGLSDLEVSGADRLIAIGDFGSLFEARLLFDSDGRLTGMTDGRLAPLLGPDGNPVPDKTEGDAEGMALLPSGDRLVSFERLHRVWLYPADGGPPRSAPTPDVRLPDNAGLEAVAADPEAGPDAYIVGAESSGETWLCRLSTGCRPGPRVDKEKEFGLVAMRRLPGGRTVYLLRAFDATRGTRISLQVFESERMIDRLDLARPQTVDNFEGVAAVLREDESVRFYLLSDDNASSSQRTLLLAFEWRPG